MKTGIDLITEERKRQIEEEFYDSNNDDMHTNGELAAAAATYALPQDEYQYNGLMRKSIFWPWKIMWFKPEPESRVRELQKAGALIAAEIDRLLRAENN